MTVLAMRWHRRRRREMSCRELVELVTLYLDDALPAEDHARFEAHLRDCPHCETYVAQFVQTVDALGALPAPQLEAEALDALLELYRGFAGPR